MDKLINTFGIDARCTRLLEFSSVDELRNHWQEIAEARRQGKLLIIGRGSNLLPTGDYDGLVVRSRIMGRNCIENDRVVICSGETVDDIIAWSIAQGLYGMENLSLIPGEVGASAVQNIGAYGVEAKDFITSLHALDIETGEIVEITNAECEYGYRQSRFKKDWKNRFIITDVTYQLSTTFTPHLDYGNIRKVLEEKGISCNVEDGQLSAQLLRDTIIDIRNAKLPDYEVEGNAGSFFMNPIVSNEKFEELIAKYPNMPYYPVSVPASSLGRAVEGAVKLPAGWLIDQCGWKGKTLGRAGVHDKQALVLVNKGGATGEEVVALCRQIQKDVLERFGVEIHPEVNIV
ncbi:MAG: UDP-N-acetylmuramate dehydrogenase [Prevotella sp.]|nr:UDP-N-acetylmuramate dehydrogenase [Prevotella sp.]